MKVSEAIQLIQMIQINLAADLDAEDFAALELSINALKKHQDRNKLTWSGLLSRLPGETPDDK